MTTSQDQAAALRARQRPLKDRHPEDPGAALQLAMATARVAVDAVAADVPQWSGTARAGLHKSTGGDGAEACSADMLLEALARCAGVTLRSVATAMGIVLRSATVHVSGTWDARGTLGVDRESPVGLTGIEVRLEVDADALTRLVELTERYCVVAQMLQAPTRVSLALA